ncbi:AAA family ATPase [bacterium]|nr:AAA family ATPase [bacterium]
MKLAVTGKGGVGKTTISALLARALHNAGRKVIAIDVDPNANLLACMGHPEPASVHPLVELKELIEERTGVKPGSIGGMFKINPRVEDIPEKYAVETDGVKVLVAGAVKRGGSGCYCPENAFVRALVSHLLLDKDAALILDMEAGIEHLSRGTVEDVDRLLVVVEPTRCSVETAQRIRALAADLGLEHVSAVGNKIKSDADKTFLREALSDLEFVGFVPYDEQIPQAERAGQPAAATSRAAGAAGRIVRTLERTTETHTHTQAPAHSHSHPHS